MFTRQKKNYRIFVYAALVITLCILVAALMWPKEAEPVNNDNIGSDNNARIDKSIEAVSYTHLDVYKRQMYHSLIGQIAHKIIISVGGFYEV